MKKMTLKQANKRLSEIMDEMSNLRYRADSKKFVNKIDNSPAESRKLAEETLKELKDSKILLIGKIEQLLKEKRILTLQILETNRTTMFEFEDEEISIYEGIMLLKSLKEIANITESYAKKFDSKEIEDYDKTAYRVSVILYTEEELANAKAKVRELQDTIDLLNLTTVLK